MRCLLLPLVCLVPVSAASAAPRSEDAGLGGAAAASAAISASLGQAWLEWEAWQEGEPRLARSCVEVASDFEAQSLSFDFGGCESHGLTGSAELEIVGPKEVVVTFGEDFTSHGYAVAGSFTATIESRKSLLVVSDELVVSDLDEDRVTVLQQLDARLRPHRGKLQMYGTSHLAHVAGATSLEGQLEIGLGGAEPLTWALPLTQVAPADGALSLATEMTASFQWLGVSVKAQVAGTFWVEFAESCENSSVSFTTDEDVLVDVGSNEVSLPASEVEQYVNASLDLRVECPAS